ncbi:MAG: bifunctional 5,10-methylenetetrahydrofolate dehydrogenase/5,10-methenyltetrahydrofolate cyclohydrolase [Eubacteriales bacterium]|nr:bifunctional 5,10-methylenetetrahydrofolate dehydrogenase/5,10-methenyltetrahydrofolate cyclohydrolase [Eubacteriales bacterium]
MTKILSGKEVAEELNLRLERRIARIKAEGTTPCLAIVRAGNDPDDVAYEKSASHRAAQLGIDVEHLVFPQDVCEEVLIENIQHLNMAESIHGILVLRPLPSHIDDDRVRNALCPDKDVDGITDASAASVFVNGSKGYPPCTAEACIRILDHYGIGLAGKRAVVIGRSTVVGKPVAMMLLHRNATVTICHTKTVDAPAIAREADILIAAVGRRGLVDSAYFHENQVVVDVGINLDENGKMCGDVDPSVAGQVAAYTPVPGGIGAVTTGLLIRHVVQAAEKKMGEMRDYR